MADSMSSEKSDSELSMSTSSSLAMFVASLSISWRLSTMLLRLLCKASNAPTLMRFLTAVMLTFLPRVRTRKSPNDSYSPLAFLSRIMGLTAAPTLLIPERPSQMESLDVLARFSELLMSGPYTWMFLRRQASICLGISSALLVMSIVAAANWVG